MEFIPVLLFLIFIIVVGGHIVGLIFGHGAWTRSFEYIATRYGGWFTPARLTRPPAVTFQYRSHQVRVRCRWRRIARSKSETVFRIRWPAQTMRLAILPIGLVPMRRSLQGRLPVPTGDTSFDQAFNVFFESRKPQDIDRIISSGVRCQIIQLQNLLRDSVLMVSVDKGKLIIRTGRFIKKQETLDDFVRFCLEFYDQVVLTMTEDIEFSNEVAISANDEMRCPICSCDIEGKMVVCVRCKTPHCLDCWQYNTKCGMYACDEQRYVVVGQ